MSEGKKYIVHGVKAECSEGTMQNYINTDTGHGVLYQGQPLLNANDHMPQVNLTHFGDCNSKKIYEKAKEQVDEKYKAEEGDGFFAKAGKFIAKTASKAVLDVKETIGIHKCELDTPLPWMFCNSEHMIDGAPALTEDSQCPCRYGGTIRIVKEGVDSGISGQDGHIEIEKTETMAVTAALLNAEAQQPETSDECIPALKGKNKQPESPNAGISRTISEIAKEVNNMDTVDMYVNEDKFREINPNWNSASFKKNYGKKVFDKLRKLMRQYGITDKTSILMFIATIGTESWYGTYVTEKYNDGYFAAKSYTKNTRGAGLIQLTGSVQKDFLQYLRSKAKDNSERAKELDSYINSFYEKENENGTVVCSKKNAAEYIAKNYALESAVWYWTKCKSMQITKSNKQVKVSINEFIKSFNGKNCNLDNVFLAVQYKVNGSPFALEELETMGKSKKGVINGSRAQINGKSRSLPGNWDSRNKDWKNAKKFLKGK